MSYILDALKKAERERALGRPPDLSTFPASTASSRRRLWPWGWGLAIVLNAALLASLWWFVREDAASVPPASSTELQSSTAGPVVIETIAAPPAVTETPPPMSPPSSRAAENAAALPAAPARPASPPVTVTDPKPSAPVPELPLPEPRLSRSASTPDSQTPAPGQIEKAPEVKSPPVLRAMSESFRRSLPALNLDVHVYGERPEHRFVMINARRYNEGDWLNEGPLLETITADGAILRYQGQRFMLELPR